MEHHIIYVGLDVHKDTIVVALAEGGERRYLGYRVLVYYNDELQAVQAEPARLLKLFPPSSAMSSP